MPRRIQKPCRAKACKRLHRNGNGYCDDHAQLAVGWMRSHQGKSSTERGYGADWERMREETLKADDYLCRPCRSQGILTPATEVDHIVPKAKGGTDAPANRQSLCHECHKAKTLAERTGGGSKVQGL